MTPPERLPAKTAARFTATVDLLKTQGTFRDSQADTITLYVETLVKYERCMDLIKRQGMSYSEERNGNVVEKPCWYVVEARHYNDQILRLQAALMMTATSQKAPAKGDKRKPSAAILPSHLVLEPRKKA